ncbi:hypothetical protein F2Q69_00013134 [Brassica cretica]|uniref:Uncharacterized protein n=1 Tax=Brassica cretica TaxID=69181 RepID=A0A8S9R147_BRACR|nr:hypothetical protein F2Q69_00013134 [Brassica cretica]
MIWLRYNGASIEEQTRMHGFGSYPLIDVRDSSVAMQRPDPRRIGCYERFGRSRVGRYVATDRVAWLVTT